MKRKLKLKLVSNSWQQPSTSPNPQPQPTSTSTSTSSLTDLALPDITTLKPDIAFIVAKALAVHHGLITIPDAENVVAQHHRDLASAHLSMLSEVPNGLKSKTTAEMQTVTSDLAGLDSQLAKIDKYKEVDVGSDLPKTLAEKVELIVTVAAAVLLGCWSIYAMHAFLEGTGILSGAPAWGVSVGPIIFAYVMKDAFNAIDDIQKKHLRLIYIGITGIASIAWISTFGHEAGAPLAAFNSLEAVDATQSSNTGWFLLRGISQMFIEIFGGAILFVRVFELWKQTASNQKVVKELMTSPHYEAAEADQSTLRNRQLTLSKHLGQIGKWFDTHASFQSQFATKATSELTHNINILKASS